MQDTESNFYDPDYVRSSSVSGQAVLDVKLRQTNLSQFNNAL